MHFLSMKWKNCFSYGNYYSEINLDRKGIVFIRGINLETGTSNGSGKSSINDILVWALYGRTLKDMPIDNIKCLHSRGFGHAQVRFAMGKDIYTLDRYRKSSEYGNGVTITKNNEDPVHYGTLKKAQKRIDSIIGLDFDAFVASLIFSSEVAFEFPRMKAEKRRQFMEKITKMESYSEIGKKASKMVRDLRKKQDSLETMLAERKRYLSDEREDYLKHKQLHEGFDVEKDEQIEDLIAKRRDVRKEIKKIDVKARENLEKEYADAMNQYDKNYDLLHEAKLEKEKAKAEPKEYQNQLDKLEYQLENDLDKVERKQSREVKDREKKIKRMEKDCPTCERGWEPNDVEKLTKKYEAEIERINQETDKEISSLNDKASKERKLIQEKLNKAKKYYESLKEKTDSLEEGQKIVLDKVQGIEGELSNLPTKEELDELAAEEKRLTSEISVVEKSESPYKVTLNNLRVKIQKLIKEIDEANKEKEKVEDELKYAVFWDDSFNNDGLKLFVFEQVVPILNNRIMYYLPQLFDGKDITLEFDKYMKMVIEKDGEIIPYGGLSKGERKRVDLAISLALLETAQSQHGVVSNVMMFDELIDSSLDKQGIKTAMDILRNMPIACKFLISHRSEIADEFDDIITVEKKGNLSQIV